MATFLAYSILGHEGKKVIPKHRVCSIGHTVIVLGLLVAAANHSSATVWQKAEASEPIGFIVFLKVALNISLTCSNYLNFSNLHDNKDRAFHNSPRSPWVLSSIFL